MALWESDMDRASRRVGGLTALVLVGGAAWWWHAATGPGGHPGGGVAIVAGRSATEAHPAVARVVVTPAPVASATPIAADPVVAARRDTSVLAAVADRKGPDAKVLDGAMARQDRDAATAGPTEGAMRTALMQVPLLAAGTEAPRVLCVDTTCEVTGVAAAGRTREEVEAALRDPVLLRVMMMRGYMPGPATIAPTSDGGVGYVLYLNDKMGSRVTTARQ